MKQTIFAFITALVIVPASFGQSEFFQRGTDSYSASIGFSKFTQSRIWNKSMGLSFGFNGNLDVRFLYIAGQKSRQNDDASIGMVFHVLKTSGVTHFGVASIVVFATESESFVVGLLPYYSIELERNYIKFVPAFGVVIAGAKGVSPSRKTVASAQLGVYASKSVLVSWGVKLTGLHIEERNQSVLSGSFKLSYFVE